MSLEVSSFGGNSSLANKLQQNIKQTNELFVGNVGLKPSELKSSLSSRLAFKLLDDYSVKIGREVSKDIHFEEELKETKEEDKISELENEQFQIKKQKYTDLSSNIPSKNKNSNKEVKYNIENSKNSLNQKNDQLNFQEKIDNNSKHISNTVHSISSLIDEFTSFNNAQPLQNDTQNTTLLSLNQSSQLQLSNQQNNINYQNNQQSSNNIINLNIKSLPTLNPPKWHPPWKLQKVISGHQGWVQCLAVDPSNEWFASGGNDRLIKIWDLASGILKLSLTGHINTIKDLTISERHPYLFSCGEDNKVKCWDLEQNKIIRDYHGHLSGVYCLSLHPKLDILATGGRDAAVRVWDVRTKKAVYTLSGHTGTIMSVITQSNEPQLISGAQDKTIRLWDLKMGTCSAVLTNHKKSIRAMSVHPSEYTFCSCAADNVKIWKCPDGRFNRNIDGHNAIINCCAIKDNGLDGSVLVSGTNNGQLNFWDWKSGYKFDVIQSRVQPGSLESENGIFAAIFDKSETRLLTGECDKTIKIWKEDFEATPESNPIRWKPPKLLKNY